ncbi:MAG: transcription elongation factor GreA [Anaerolineaceae bacterium]|jgi:transcription elongation factor GreA|nr:transcription elongation factor GreA [Anaerolineae bacterium]MBL1172682.1 transcription elongation factor GreA [Chloroflexota bacterium]MBV6465862.1 Transcription elongation factor GreA [Anaerolineales bacterium]MDL1927165.1 transcription elongation factor GreA [Anaerolineae bacterium AMX1]OQY85235.1 MAG: transcription elongation factor GreA [Anaerolineae bacterium UTCFX3]GER81347.1 transcription elongation factor GreA [Candidatus Denitrolinea symbiosum]GJQ38039.1 MAG: transcription elonga
MPDIHLTAEGLAKIKVELEELKGPRREELAARLRSAIQMGDLSENADYHKAKEDQAFLEGRIQELEFMARNAVVIEKSSNNDVVSIGSRVTIQEEDYPAETYHLVGPAEADPRNGRISHESPIGSALMDRRVGDSVEVETPAGKTNFKILKIE